MNNLRTRRILMFVVILLFIIGWTVLLYHYRPRQIVNMLGVRDSYLTAFLISLFGAFSSFTPFSTYPAIIALGAGKVNPFILGAIAGIGLTIGDVLFFYFGITARAFTTEKFQEKLKQWLIWLQSKPDIYIYVFIFLYVGFSPFPNNALTGTLALMGYPLRKLLLPLLLGDMALPILLAYLAYRGVELLPAGF